MAARSKLEEYDDDSSKDTFKTHDNRAHVEEIQRMNLRKKKQQGFCHMVTSVV